MDARVLVLPSPLLGPSAYAPFVDVLSRVVSRAELAAGLVGPATDTSAPSTLVDRLVDRWATQGDALGANTLVAHSNSGYLAPLVRARLASNLAIVFMDAALPPIKGTGPLAPERLRSLLDSLADDAGILPSWTRWWPTEDLERLAPASLLHAIDGDCPRLPLAYFDALVRPPTGWADERNAYIAFGDTYADELALATAHGWPVRRRDGQHLDHAVSPAPVAADVLGLLDELSR
jgi:hypothetical protein